MKRITSSLLASFAIAAAAAPYPPAPLPEPAAGPQAAQNLATFYPSVQSAVSAYFNTLGVKGDQARKGLVIPWVVTAPLSYTRAGLWGKPQTDVDDAAPVYVHGYAVALGKTAGGCPLFKIQGVDERDIRWRMQPATPMAFPPVTAVCP